MLCQRVEEEVCIYTSTALVYSVSMQTLDKLRNLDLLVDLRNGQNKLIGFYPVGTLNIYSWL